jgi:hypothetical protein
MPELILQQSSLATIRQKVAICLWQTALFESLRYIEKRALHLTV